MQVRSAKAKGRIFQNWVRDTILTTFLHLTNEDVRCAIMGETNADIKLSSRALKVFPYKIEAKSQKKGFSAVYNAYEQCEKHKEIGEPLVIIKQNKKKPLAIMDAEYFIRREYDKR